MVSNNAVDKVIDRNAVCGRVGGVYGGAIDEPFVVLRLHYGEVQFSMLPVQEKLAAVSR